MAGVYGGCGVRKPSHAFRALQVFGPKRQLIRLVESVETISEKIYDSEFDALVYQHSHSPQHSNLSNFLKCILVAEDRRFFRHVGFDIKSLARTIRFLIMRRRISGVSTIDQQVVRIARNRFERTYSRKLSEILYAVLIQFHCSKSEILQYYIHNAYLGYGLEGCETASRKIFKRNATSLSVPEAALISALFARPLKARCVQEFEKTQLGPISFSDAMRIIQHSDPAYYANLDARVQYLLRLVASLPKSRLIK